MHNARLPCRIALSAILDAEEQGIISPDKVGGTHYQWLGAAWTLGAVSFTREGCCEGTACEGTLHNPAAEQAALIKLVKHSGGSSSRKHKKVPSGQGVK